MTFDNVPWIATMKKNEHYFPTIEYSKDSAEPLGWRKTIHECDEGGAREEIAPADVDMDGGHEGLIDSGKTEEVDKV